MHDAANKQMGIERWSNLFVYIHATRKPEKQARQNVYIFQTKANRIILRKNNNSIALINLNSKSPSNPVIIEYLKRIISSLMSIKTDKICE